VLLSAGRTGVVTCTWLVWESNLDGKRALGSPLTGTREQIPAVCQATPAVVRPTRTALGVPELARNPASEIQFATCFLEGGQRLRKDAGFLGLLVLFEHALQPRFVHDQFLGAQ
jgi:hypothetical protein